MPRMPHFARPLDTLEHDYFAARLRDLRNLVTVSSDALLARILSLLTAAEIFAFGEWITLTDGVKWLTHSGGYPAKGLAQIFGKAVPLVPPSSSGSGQYFTIASLPSGELYWSQCAAVSIGDAIAGTGQVVLDPRVLFHPIRGFTIPFHEGAHFAARRDGLTGDDAERYCLTAERTLLAVAQRDMPVRFHRLIGEERAEIDSQLARP